MKLPYQLLKELTNCFAEDRKLGSGAFGVVYKGVRENGEEIAVKRFHNMAVDDSEFQKEFQNLRRLKHQNIVELVGYCNETEETLVEHNGQQRRVETLHMALCLEYVDNGSLGEHLSDECQGLNWHLRYKIIKGICEGLKYLREELEEPIWHLDLKPGNILLDKNMVPKIADFGLSRLFGEEKTKKTNSCIGTCGYWPPEYIKNQVISNGYDIFSLGVIIVKIMTGREGYSSIADMTRRKFIKHVHDNWKKKLQEILRRSSLEVYCEQVKRCVEIALKCMMLNRHDRPSIQEIVSNLNETEIMIRVHGLQIEQFYDGESILPSKSSVTTGPFPERGGDSSRSNQMENRLMPRNLPFHLLEGITDGFSEERKLGRGHFAVVYKGVYENGEAIAVKKLHDMPGLDDKQFKNEIENLVKVHHQNIVQLIGYCRETQSKSTNRRGTQSERANCRKTQSERTNCRETQSQRANHKGKHVFAERTHMVLCLEYLQNGSLDRYISDECSGLEWHTRYGIIRGTCEGLRHLHEGLRKPILHLDLKPSKILLDENMVPKIGGFLLLDENTYTRRIIGTRRYMPPEYIEKGVISDKHDIFSLGVTILQIIAGHRLHYHEMSSQQFIDLVHGKWRKRLQATLKDTSSVEGYCHQVKKCIEIAFKCLETERLKRPSIGDIVHMLNETETLIHKQDDPELLDVHPTELFFPFEPKKLISCSLQMTNKGDDSVAFRLLAKNSRRYLTKLPLCGVVPPRCTYTLALTMRKQPQPPPSNSDDFFTLQSIELRDLDLENSIAVDYDNFIKEAEETAGDEVRKVTLTVACRPAEEATSAQPNQSGIMIISTQNSRQVLSVDVHPTDPWIMTSNHGGNVCIWNYEMMETVNYFEVSEEPVHSAKFIAREQWFVAGDGNGYIYVYNYDTMEEDNNFVAHGRRVTSLAVHPTRPYVLSSSSDHLIKLWDWEKGWECTRTFLGHSTRVAQVTFNPNDTNRFTSASLDRKAKIWTLDSPDPDNTLDGHSDDLTCVDYGTGGDRRYLLTGSKDGTAQIWDMKKQKCIRKLEGHADRLSAVYWHPELPILTTGSLDGTVRIWNSTTYRLENVISFNLGAVYAFVYIKGLRRIVVGCHQGIAMMEINLQ